MVNTEIPNLITTWSNSIQLLLNFFKYKKGISLVGVPKKVVPLSKSIHVSVSSEFFLQIKLILSSPNVVLTFYTYTVSNKKVSS
jgi:hypothetical protein